MILSAHQPAYLPWLGYFEKIQKVDIFVFLDTVQFEKNSFINRNKIKTKQGAQWLTIPVKTKGHINSTLLETEVDDNQNWRKKHLKSVEMNYKKGKFFSECFSKFENLVNIPSRNLAEICWNHLVFWLKEFEISTKIFRLSELSISSKKSDLILDLCKEFSANYYLSGVLGKGYLEEGKFLENGITIKYQDFQHPIYNQIEPDFEPNLGIVDYWMNCGPGKLPI